MRRIAPAIGLVVLLPLLLTGCGVQDLLQKRTSGTADSRDALGHAWRTPASQPDWVPADAKRIRYVAATDGSADATPASVRVTMRSALPEGCTTVPRHSLDAFGEDWAPSTVPEVIERCGNWAVVRVDGGWFGWTPLSPRERAEPAGPSEAG